MKKRLLAYIVLLCFLSVNAQITTITRNSTLIKSNHNFGLTHPLFDQANNVMQYDAGLVDTNGAAFTYNFTNTGGTGYKGYPSGTVGGYKSGGTYYPGNVATSGMPVQISALQNNLRIKWKVSQQNANDPDDKWWASINVIFDGGTATSEPDPNARDYDLVIALKQYAQEDTTNEPKVIGGGAYWYFAKNPDGSLKTVDLNYGGTVYKFAVRYKFFSYNVGDPNFDKNDKVHTKFIPIDNSNVAPYLDHSLKFFIDKTKEYIQYANLPTAELALANQKVADPTLYVKSIAAGYEVYTGSFTINNDYFYTVLDSTAPAAPVNLTTTKSGNSAILDWNDNAETDLDTYKVYRSVNGGAYTLLADNVLVSNYTDTTILNGSVYNYYVVVQDRSLNVSTQSNATTINLQSYTPQEMVTMMGTGINLGNILSAPSEGNWADPLTETYVDNVYRLGFKTVRIPIRFDAQTTPFSAVTYTDALGNYIGSPSQYSVNQTYLNRISTIIDWCTSRNLNVIIDVHGDHWFWGSFNPSNSEYKTGNDRLAAIDRFKAIWRDIATAFQNKPQTVLFEIMNEAYFDMSADDVNSINPQMLSVIRQTNPTRNVIVNGGGKNSWEAPMQMSDAFLQSDSHLIATFHYYLPFKFTSSATQANPDTDWGTAADKATVDSNFQAVKNWSVLKNIPIYVGEYGADNVLGYDYNTNTSGTVGPDVASRFAYHQYIAQVARSKGFASTVWDAGHKSGKTIYINPSESWVKDVRNAVLGSTSTNQILVNNADIGFNYDYNWAISSSGTGTVAKINNATPPNNYSGPSLNIIVTSTAGAYNNVIVSNDTFTTGFVAGKTYNIKFYAKSDTNQEVRVRISKNGTTSILSTFVLTNTYTQYTTSYTVPADATSLQLQLLCGKTVGNMYFDNFEVTDSTTLATIDNNTQKSLVLCPNPVKNDFEIKSNEQILSVEIYSAEGKLVKSSKQKDKYSVNDLSAGVYIVKIKTPKQMITKKIIKK